MNVTIRPIEQRDAGACGKIGYLAHKTISSAHGYPSEQPSEEFGIDVMKRLVGNPNSWGFLAEEKGNVLGSIFIHKFSPSPIAVIGPLTVHPSTADGGGRGIGRLLMDTALSKASEQNLQRIRLVQSPSHIRSFVLYTKCGFTLREPLFLMQRSSVVVEGSGPISIPDKSIVVRPIKYQNDISECNELCKQAHGFTREMELRQAKSQGIATLIERDDVITGYAAGIDIFGYVVAKSNEDLIVLITNASTSIIGPGFFVPARNYELIKWLLENGFKIGWPANLMTIGPYQEPLMPFLPSLAY
ncbi:MAG: GNAT family N-acetyltransferase [Candidatus Nitrosocosmicus sp.]